LRSTRIVKAGGVIVSASEGLDYATDIRHMLRSLLSWAEWELDRTRATWRIACERAVQRGVFVGGVPFGYRRGKDGRLRTPGLRIGGDESSLPAAPMVRRSFRCAIGSRSRHQDGARPPCGTQACRRRQRRVYLGESYYGDVE
jgi:hypothetical protein